MSDTLFPKGGPNPSGAYFTGQSYMVDGGIHKHS